MQGTTETLFAQIGAEKLRAVLAAFYDRLFEDVMIGFFFRGKDKARLVEKEWELTARLLGAPVSYTGRVLREAHASSPIMGGHFDRRLQILKETLRDHDVPAAVAEAWISHTNALRGQITGDGASECDHGRAASRLS
ncbi:MAG: group 1 truncated hemoglobin [Acidobacteriota bacterium]